MDPPEKTELLIVGAGLHGLAMAKTYLQVNPKAKIIIADKAETLGGSWAKERLYPGLKTNNVFGSYEFGDFVMAPEAYGEKPGRHIPGNVVHAYFREVASSCGVDLYIRYRTSVNSATRQEDGRWMVQLSQTDDPSLRSTIIAERLVVATGLTSTPYLPDIPLRSLFNAMIIHSKQLKEHAANLSKCKDVVVLGGNKSSWDVCYSAAKAGSQVHMVMRPEGGGPSYLWPRSFKVGPFNLSLAYLSSSRFFTLFDPTPFGEKSRIKNFLHGTVLGSRICQFFWRMLDSRIRKLNGYDTHPEMKKLEPWQTPFWMGNSLSIHNYDDDWFDLVRNGQIHIHIAEIEFLANRTVLLSDGQSLMADALVCCTGWDTNHTFEIKLSENSVSITNSEALDIGEVMRVQAELYGQMPFLHTVDRRTPNAPAIKSNIPPICRIPPPHYRLVVSSEPSLLNQRNLAFIGSHSSPHAVVVAQAQALWITAFFQGNIHHLQPEHINMDEVRKNTIRDCVYSKVRRPKETGGSGERYPDLVFDSIPYVDTLLDDLGLERRRKGSWWAEMFDSYRPKDYRGIVDEWLEKRDDKRE